jgi:4-amino-4-deoxy-L-arabinose transferase-like glycosyltransferase
LAVSTIETLNSKGFVKQIASLIKHHIPLTSLLLLMLVVSIASRFYMLGQIPHGITWDEAAIGYNGYSVITTRRDEWLQRLPISFQSYGDYKAPLAIYIVGVSTFLLGVTPFAVRLPFALAGIVFIGSFGFLVKELFQFSKNYLLLTLLAIVFAITSPWHFHYSRIGFESGLALSFVTFSLASLVYVNTAFTRGIFNRQSILLLVLSGVSLVASVYTYHSAKIVVPLLMIFLALKFRTLLLQKKWIIGAISLVCLGMLYPLLQDSLTGSGAERANVLLTSQGLALPTVLGMVFSNFLAHFSLDFLVFGQMDSFRHGIGSWGVLTPVTYLLAALGLFSICVTKHASIKKIGLWAIVLIFVGILPAALSAETVPHSNRSLLALPGFLLLAVVGVETIQTFFISIESELRLRQSVGTILLLECLFFISLFHFYTTSFVKLSTPDFQDGYLEAMTIAKEYEKGENGKPEVANIMFSSEYGQPYMYALFVRKTSPMYYRGGSLNKYTFTDQISVADLDKKGILVVSTPSMELPTNKATHTVYGQDGSPRFLLFYTGN